MGNESQPRDKARIPLKFAFLGLAAAFILVLAAFTLASAVTLFSDGFESNDFSKWTAADSEWKVKGGDTHSGSKKAEIKDTDGDKILREATSTVGYEIITIGYWYKIEKQLESEDHVYLEWTSDGTTWNTATDTTNVPEGPWTSATSTLPAGAADQSGFQFRFRANLDAGNDVFWLDDVLLTGERIPPASLTIIKDADPNDPQDFTFSNSFASDFTLDDDSDPTLSDRVTFSLAAGTYSVSETVPAGWDLTATNCSDGSSANAIQLSAGESVTCTFTDTQRGHVIVSKITDPADDPTVFAISMSGTGATTGNLSRELDAASSVDYEVTPGTYSVGEAVPTDWQLTDNTCSNVQVNAGATVQCTITNQKLGTIIVEKHTDPAASSQRFSFKPSYGESFTLGDGEQNTSDFLVPGTYSVSESVPAGWDLTSINCVYDNQSVGISDPENGKTVELGAGDTITCAFNDRQRGSIKITKISDPADETLFGFDLAGPTPGETSLASGGSFTFENLIPGAYTLGETLPEGWSGSSRIACSAGTANSIPLAAGAIVTCDINNTEFASISGRKFLDQNADGDGTGEPGLPEWTIALLDEDEEELATTQTESDGSYLFRDLAPGTYFVCETLKTNWFQSFPRDEENCSDAETNGYVVTLGAGEPVVGKDFGNYQRVSISGEKFNDLNGDGVRRENEPGLASWTISLFDGSATTTTTTAEDGSFKFSNLLPGKTYSVSEELQAGWTQTTPDPAPLQPSSGDVITGLVFGNFPHATIHGFKWWDKNADGIQQQEGSTAEPGRADWPISLVRVERQVPAEGPAVTIETEIVALALTGANGGFTLPADRPGNFRVREGSRPNWERTHPPDSFFDVFVDLGGSDISTDTHNAPLAFGNVFFVDILGGKFVPSSGEGTSTPSAAVRGKTTISVPLSGGTSTIALADGTTITRNDGGDVDLNALSAGEATSSLSGLGQGAVLDGALHWGIANLGLGFAPPITVSIFVGEALNGQTLEVVRSASGSGGWTNDGIGPPTTCLVASGLCTFSAAKASFYAATHTPPPPPPPPASTSGEASGGGGGGAGGGLAGSITQNFPQPTSQPTTPPAQPPGTVLRAQTENVNPPAPTPPPTQPSGKNTSSPSPTPPPPPGGESLGAGTPPPSPAATETKPSSLLATIGQVVSLGTGSRALGGIVSILVLLGLGYIGYLYRKPNA